MNSNRVDGNFRNKAAALPWTLSGLACVALVVTGCAGMPAPTDQLAVSKAAVSNATSAGAPEFASSEMRMAQEKLDSANKAMVSEDHKQALWMAEQAQVDAQLATTKARAAKAQKAVDALNEDSRILREEIERGSNKPMNTNP